jgi:hypothetical protein
VGRDVGGVGEGFGGAEEARHGCAVGESGVARDGREQEGVRERGVGLVSEGDEASLADEQAVGGDGSGGADDRGDRRVQIGRVLFYERADRRVPLGDERAVVQQRPGLQERRRVDGGPRPAD